MFPVYGSNEDTIKINHRSINVRFDNDRIKCLFA